MSSILNALKKLENESVGKSEYSPTDTRTVLNRNIKGIWLLNKLMTILITTLCVVGSVWILLVWKPDVIWRLQPSGHQEKTSEPSGSHLSTPASAPLESAPAHVQTDIPSQTAKPDTAQASKVLLVQPPEKSSAPLPPPAGLHDAKPAKPIIIIKTETDSGQKLDKDELKKDKGAFSVWGSQTKSETTEAMEDESAVMTEDDELSMTVDQNTKQEEQSKDAETFLEKDSKTVLNNADIGDAKYDKTPILSDERLKIQALVWAANPDNRFAVINDRVLKNGGFINEILSLTYIGSNFVIVKEGSKQWKIEFQIK